MALPRVVRFAEIVLALAGGSASLAVAFQTPIDPQPGPQGGNPQPTGRGWNGPGDTVPGGNGGAPPPAPNAPAGPGTAGPNGPTGGASPGTPATPAPTLRPAAVALESPTDVESWEMWWLYNRDVVVDGRALIAATYDATTTGPRERPASIDARQAAVQSAPALLALLDKETHPELLAAAGIALARLDLPSDGSAAELDARIDAALARLLAHTQLQVCESAALALGLRAKPFAAATLISVLRDDDAGRKACGRVQVPERVRSMAAFALGLAADATASEDLRRFVVHGLWNLFDGPSATSRDLQTACVSALGLARVHGGEELVRDAGAGERVLDRAAKLPAASTRAALVARLFDVLFQESRQLAPRAQAPVAIARLAQDGGETLRAECIERLVGALATLGQRAELREGCIIALGALTQPIDTPHDRAARAALTAAARDGERATRGLALVGAGRVAARAKAAEDLTISLELQRLLVQELAHGRSGTSGWAALALGLAGYGAPRLVSSEVDRALERYVSEAPSKSEGAAATLALGMRGSSRSALGIAGFAIEAGDDSTRANSALGLGLTRSRDGLEALRKISDHALQRPFVLREASVALSLCGDHDVALRLLESGRREKSSSAHISLAGALAYVGTAYAAAPVVDLVRDPNLATTSRIAWVRALGAVADESTVPWNACYARDVNYLAPSDTLTSVSGSGILDLD